MPKLEDSTKQKAIGGNGSHKTTPAGILKHISRFYPKNKEKASCNESEISSDRNGGMMIGVCQSSNENLQNQVKKD